MTRLSTDEWLDSTKAHKLLKTSVKDQVNYYASELDKELRDELSLMILITIRAFEEQSKE